MNKLIYLVLITSIIGCKKSQNTTSNDDNVKSLGVDKKETTNEETDFFSFEPDIRIFTVLAFVNAGGYDPFYSDSIPVVRKEIRLYLDSIITDSLKSEIKNIIQPDKRHRFIVPQIYLALNLTYPPNFKWLPDSLRAKPEAPFHFKDKNQYLKILNEFYIKADIPKLWGKYAQILAANNFKYSKFGSKAIKNITDFCRVDSNFYRNKFGKFNFYEEELANKGWGSIFTSKDTVFYFMNFQVQGIPAFYHESLHLLINPITENYSQLLQTKKDIVKIGSDKRLKLGTYIHLNDLFSECMVTTIDFTLREKYDNCSDEEIMKNIDREYDKGLILVPYFYSQLKEYQKSKLTLEHYYPTIIEGIDIEKEKTMWKEFIENKNTTANSKIPASRVSMLR